MKTIAAKGALGLALVSRVLAQSTPANEALWEARAGETTRITAAPAQGADVNAKARYDVTALFFAASSGRPDAVKLLLVRGANVNAEDSFYKSVLTSKPELRCWFSVG
jgi:ankyrin repeat protein